MFFLFLGLVVLLVMHLQLRERVAVLEREKENRPESKGVVAPVTANAQMAAPPPPPASKPLLWPEYTAANTQPVVAAVAPPPPAGSGTGVEQTSFAPRMATPSVAEPAGEFFLYTWFKEQTLIKIGAILFFLGAVWFVGYAITEGWLRPEVQILLAFALACIAYGVGVWRARVDTVQYIVLTTLGTGIAMAATFAGQQLYALLPSPFALMLLCATIAYTVWVSVRTKTEWLAVVSVIAGLVSPLLVNAPEPSYPLLLTYLLVLAAGFSALVWLTRWRLVTLVTVAGVYLFQLALLERVADNVLWFFVVLSTALFFASSATSMARANAVLALDVIALAIVGVVFSIFASAIALSDSLALFVATIVVAGTGYAFRLRGLSGAVQSVMAGFALGTLLMGTTFLFSGYQLALAYAVEITTVFCLLTYLGVRPAVRGFATVAFVLPVLASFEALFGNAWRQGVVHGEAFLTLVIITMLFGVALWCVEQPRVRAEAWAAKVAGGFAVIGYFYTLVAGQRFAEGLAPRMVVDEVVIMYVLWGLVAVSLVWYMVVRSRTADALTYATLGMVPPLLFSLGSLTVGEWNTGVLHPHAVGSYLTLSFLGLILLLIYNYYERLRHSRAMAIFGVWGLISMGYVFLVLARFWDGVLPRFELSYVALYTSYACIVYALAATMINLRVAWSWVRVVLVLYILPLLLSISSLTAATWSGSAVHPDAMGLYACSTLAALLAVGLYTRTAAYTVEAAEVRGYAKAFAFVAGLYGFALIWLIAGALTPSAAAGVVVALFVYSVSGLALYSYGRIRDQKEVRYAGILLLVAVVLRLALVDVWNMEQIWKIVTFLGIGLLFIITALIEKPFQNNGRLKE